MPTSNKPINSATRASIVTLKATGQRSDDVAFMVGVTRRAVDKIYARAITTVASA